MRYKRFPGTRYLRRTSRRKGRIHERRQIPPRELRRSPGPALRVDRAHRLRGRVRGPGFYERFGRLLLVSLWVIFALFTYRQSVVDLHRAQGTILQSRNIVVEEAAQLR